MDATNPGALYAVIGAIFPALGGLFAQAWAKHRERGEVKPLGELPRSALLHGATFSRGGAL